MFQVNYFGTNCSKINHMSAFGERLSELRTERGLSRSDLAKSLNISVRSVSYWETGQRECSFDMLVKIAKFFSVNTDYLLGRNDY